MTPVTRVFLYAITFVLNLMVCGLTGQRAFRHKSHFGWDASAKSDLFTSIFWGVLAMVYFILFLKEAFMP